MKKCFAMLVLLLATSVLAEENVTGRFEKVISKMVKAINEGNPADIGSDFDKTMEDFFPWEKRKPFLENLSAQYGKIQELEEPHLAQPSQAIFVAHCERGALDITVWLNDNNKVIGLLFLPHKPDMPVPEKNETNLSLPFRGKWLSLLPLWGGIHILHR